MIAVQNQSSRCLSAWEPLKRILSCSSFDDISGSMLRPLAETVHASRGVFLQFMGLPLRGVLLGQRTYLGDENRLATDVYAGDGLYVEDPLAQPLMEWLHSELDQRVPALTLLSRVPDWRERSIYSRFLYRFHIGHVLAVAVPATTILGREMLCLGLHRPEGAEPFSGDDIARLEGLMPAVRSVLSNLAHQEAIRLSGTAIDELSDVGGGLGLALLDQDLQIRQLNRRAMNQFGAHGALFGAIRKRLLDDAPEAGAETQTILSFSNQGSRPVKSVKIHVRAFQGADGHTFYLVLITNVSHGTDLQQAAAHLGLTQREREVAVLVCAGRSSLAIGNELGITQRTVENHLRAVYQKAGVNNRTQLASTLLGARERSIAEA